MPTYKFTTINTPESQGYVASRDDLDFTGVVGATTAKNITVDVAPYNFTIRINSTGASVMLGAQAAGEVLTLPDGSKLAFGGLGAETLSGAAGADQIYGGGGQDQLIGRAGPDLLHGGDDYDTFVFAPGDSGVVEGQIDVIDDWGSAFEKLQFSTPMTGGGYAELTAATFAEALQAANLQIATGAVDVVSAQVGLDVIVFADTRNDNGGADDAIMLKGAILGRIDAVHMVGLGSAGSGTGSGPGTGPIQPSPSTGTLTFETMTVAQALGYNAANNDLRFEASRSGSTAIFVGFNPDGTVDVTSGAGFANQTVTFGAGIYGEANLIFSDGTRSVIGSAGDDLMLGNYTLDSLWAGPGRDTLNGAGNPDRLYGGTGADLFIVGESGPNAFDSVGDWEAVDHIAMGGPGATAASYLELEGFSGLDAAAAAAASRIGSGEADYVAVQVTSPLGSVVYVFADTAGRDEIGARVGLQGATLAKIDYSNIVATPFLAFPALAPLPGAALSSAAPLPVTYVGGEPLSGFVLIRGNMDTAHVGDSRTGQIVSRDARGLEISGGQASSLLLSGRGLTYREDAAFVYDLPTGTVDYVRFLTNGFSAGISGPSVAGTTVFHWILNDSTQQMFATYLAGADNILGESGSDDLLRGFTGSDTMGGYGGNDTLWGGAGNDVLYANAPPGRLGIAVTGSTYLRGEEGDDWIGGGTGFDDINGNMGNDTAGGGDGEDWVVGGRDNDLLFGDGGYDLVYGNLGNDTCDGGAGNDIVRGGQDNDLVRGGAGDDYVSGDKGDDTVTGGAGADIFHSFGDAGIDRVTDFSQAEGDRVQLDPGTQYTVAQVGADTVIAMTGGGQTVLVGVQMGSLTAGWIFGA